MKQSIVLVVTFLLTGILFTSPIFAISEFGFGTRMFDFGYPDRITVEAPDKALNTWVIGVPNSMTYLTIAEEGGEIAQVKYGIAGVDARFETDLIGLTPSLSYTLSYEIEGLNDGKPEVYATIDIESIATTSDNLDTTEDPLDLTDVPFWAQLLVVLCGFSIIVIGGASYLLLRRKKYREPL